jgi:hypothetical protein
MSTRVTAITVGLGLYTALVLVFYGLHRLAFGDGGGPYPLWYSVSELVLNAVRAVAPGLVIGWLSRAQALRVGAVVGAVGGVIEVILLGALTGITFTEFPGRMAVATVFTAVTGAFTNAVGAAAGQFLREHAKPSNPTFERDAPQAARPSP